LLDKTYIFEKFEFPLPDDLIRKLIGFWTYVLKTDYSEFAPILAGSETEANTDILFLARRGQTVVSTCHLTISRSDPRLAGMGEAATLPEHTRKGLVTELFRQATQEFDNSAGQALFLGTSNPLAAKIYQKFGYSFLPNSNVMLHINPPHETQQFLTDYYQQNAKLSFTIFPGDAHQRITMIPLILKPHDWKVLDANTCLCSSRWFHQPSCMGLYPRYQKLTPQDNWWAATRSDGATLALASAKILDQDSVRIEAFCHPLYQDNLLNQLYQVAADWARSRGAQQLLTTCEPSDKIKLQALQNLSAQATDQIHTISTPHGDLNLQVLKLP
jgi:hypothetical protein